MTDDQHDQDLRALLRSADPAASLPTADPTRVARLLEDAMTDTQTDQSRADHPDSVRGRTPLTWLVAAAAVLVIGGGVLFAVTQGDEEPTPTAGSGPSSQASQGSDATGDERTVTELTAAGDAAAGKCLAPDAAPQVVARQTTVVDATVESIAGSSVTLVPTKFYTGDPTDLVVVQAPGPEMEALLSAVTFEEGERYLVAATDGRVTLCGFSGAYSDYLADVYAAAFPG